MSSLGKNTLISNGNYHRALYALNKTMTTCFTFIVKKKVCDILLTEKVATLFLQCFLMSDHTLIAGHIQDNIYMRRMDFSKSSLLYLTENPVLFVMKLNWNIN